jgi:hypothetical protein
MGGSDHGGVVSVAIGARHINDDSLCHVVLFLLNGREGAE